MVTTLQQKLFSAGKSDWPNMCMSAKAILYGGECRQKFLAAYHSVAPSRGGRFIVVSVSGMLA